MLNFGDLSTLAQALQERNDKDFRNGEIHQAILNLGYEEWRKHDSWDYGEMIDWVGLQYGEFAAVAILIGKYNYQVNNGGHAQYWDNGFAGEDRETYELHDRMVRGLASFGLSETELGKPVYENAKKFKIGYESYYSEWGRGDEHLNVLDSAGLDAGYDKDRLSFRWMDFLGAEVRKAIMAELEKKEEPIVELSKSNLTFSVRTPVDPNRIADLLCSAFDGGVGYWVSFRTYMPKEPDWSWCKDKSQWESVRKCYVASLCGGHVKITDLLDDDKVYKLDRAALIRGLEVMSSKYPWHFMNFINEDDDAETGDVYLQCCVLGDVVYS